MFHPNCVLTAANNVLDWDLPMELLPLTITNQADLLMGFDPDQIGHHAWDHT